ncbi:repressor of RNA polymerase III transcription MAF1 homolog [Lingula anatina]|uniref:Repressor of RNA polymerase III transcription MAF1 n=1 Tax=Lingula anatina TaxID=7574 RepID=A0A1S3H5F1_LINAN|nr:repressor of RNA polymerase III transcription MAF1 homolog [Lingula anatina]|eukprot:XP_013381365.1 repressor of RNA polymerase III transcription MAF1 homolog [Lingula anatina]
MKLLENPTFDAIGAALSGIGSGIEARLESYSCKMAGNDKKLFKDLVHEGGSQPNDLQVLSPPETGLPHSPTRQYSRSVSSDDGQGILCDTISTKTLFYLISTLNASFNPDYDFSKAKSDEFSKVPSLQWVINSVESQLAASLDNFHTLKSQLWKAIDDEIKLNECDIYSYNPDLSSDPFGEEGCIWSFNYFLYNKKLKRIVFLSCKCNSHQFANFDSGYGQEFSMEMSGDDMEYTEEEN